MTNDSNKKRGLKTRSPFSNAADTEIYKAFVELSKTTKIPMSKLYDEAMADIVEKYKKAGKI